MGSRRSRHRQCNPRLVLDEDAAEGEQVVAAQTRLAEPSVRAILLEAGHHVIARVTAFGQISPLARQPGFGSIAEAMSGFAAITGEPDGPPTLPPFGLADGIVALATSFAVTAALRSGEATGRGQVVDVALYEAVFSVIVIIVILATLLTPPILTVLLRRQSAK